MYLEEQAETIEEAPRTNHIRPMENPTKFPFGGRPAFITKRQREEEEAGSGEIEQLNDSVETPSPTVIKLDDSLKKPFMPPRKKQCIEVGSIQDPPLRILAEVDLTCKETIDEETSFQINEQNCDSSDSEEE